MSRWVDRSCGLAACFDAAAAMYSPRWVWAAAVPKLARVISRRVDDIAASMSR
ncbi:hypothetical protein PF007_g32657 [Phytophthora fragariae]|uniref:Uncharacterized protein n=1 Tax=Phytophthora fragariae TaxID=53985 RepID=A0A6A3PGK5_9STRA|nr:hypothetical protein PF007_g32657 [Phytophthora fragariae]